MFGPLSLVRNDKPIGWMIVEAVSGKSLKTKHAIKKKRVAKAKKKK